ncbi:MAG: putative baseplate assembly protein, partial [Propionicimonas sp.]|nr:putative baseplate assembly protein [Propionicimonas sp.]
ELRSLSVQYDGPRVFLWAPRAAPEGDGTGCVRLPIDELGSVDVPTLAGQWQELSKGWTGGSCWMVRVVGDTAYAASQSSGVLTLKLGTTDPAWAAPDVNCGLPLRDRRRFTPLSGVSGGSLASGGLVVLAAGAGGVHRSLDGGDTWRSCSARVVTDVVTLPPSWLFCSGEHRVEVVRAHG